MHKHFLIALIVTLVSCISRQSSHESNAKFTLDKYGEFELYNFPDDSRISDDDIVTGERIDTDTVLSIKNNRDNVEIRVGTNIGIEFSVEGLRRPKDEVVLIVIKHPLIKNPSTSKESTIDSFETNLRGNHDNQVGWVMERDWEAVKGDWTFEVYYKDKLALSKTIFTY